MKRGMIGRPVHDADLLALVPLSLFRGWARGIAPVRCAASTPARLVCLGGPWTAVLVSTERGVVETIVEPPAALDGHKARVTACVRVPNERGQREQRVAEFATTVRWLPV